MSSDLQFSNAESLMIKDNLDSIQEGIKTAEYKYGTIQNKEAFLDKLLFMGPPSFWHYCHTANPATKEGEIYNCITGYYPDRKFATIGAVARAVKKTYSGGTRCSSNDILYTLAKQSDWFKRFFILNTYFDRRLFEPLWVRNWGTKTELYLEDGNTRALTYALRLLCEEEPFCPVKIIWCRSWSHVLSWAGKNEGPEYAQQPLIDGVEWN